MSWALGVTGARKGAEEGQRIVGDPSLWKTIEDLARLAAQRGAIIGAQLGAKVIATHALASVFRSWPPVSDWFSLDRNPFVCGAVGRRSRRGSRRGPGPGCKRSSWRNGGPCCRRKIRGDGWSQGGVLGGCESGVNHCCRCHSRATRQHELFDKCRLCGPGSHAITTERATVRAVLRFY
jgi:hypothetical protein